MNPTARAYWTGLERSNGFIDFFTTGMEGDDWLQRPAGAPNPAIWILGHLAHSRAAFLEMLTGQQMYEEGWEALAGLGVDPQDASVYPDVDTCRRVLDALLRDLKSYLERANEADLDSLPCVPSTFLKTKGAVLAHLRHHEAHHTGALSMLRRLLGKERIILAALAFKRSLNAVPVPPASQRLCGRRVWVFSSGLSCSGDGSMCVRAGEGGLRLQALLGRAEPDSRRDAKAWRKTWQVRATRTRQC